VLDQPAGFVRRERPTEFDRAAGEALQLGALRPLSRDDHVATDCGRDGHQVREALVLDQPADRDDGAIRVIRLGAADRIEIDPQRDHVEGARAGRHALDLAAVVVAHEDGEGGGFEAGAEGGGISEQIRGVAREGVRAFR
jgi:hypothetical protein